MTNQIHQTDAYAKYTPAQKQVILSRGKSLLVSASAGTGKTTVMIERIASLIKEGVDVEQIVVATFTNLAAAEMKSRLAAKLMEYAKTDERVRAQLEKLDNASISTLHSFCCDLLRNYFYVVDLDPSFAILDNITVNALKKTAIDSVFREYFQNNDQDFKMAYRIFATHRKEQNFKQTIWQLHEFSKNIVDFPQWYQHRRNAMIVQDDQNVVNKMLLDNIVQKIDYIVNGYKDLVKRAKAEQNMHALVVAFESYVKTLSQIGRQSLANAMLDLSKLSLERVPQRNSKLLQDADKIIEEQIRADHESYKKQLEGLQKKFAKLSRGREIDQLWWEMESSLRITDKLVEIVTKLDKEFYSLKKQRGGLDFADLEHKTLELLSNEEASQLIRAKYKMVFVDEYQDTNYVQEAIVTKLVGKDNLFMVGDVKQSIYGFRGCEPSIFVEKQRRFDGGSEGELVKLNANFRSNLHILDFVNQVFGRIMTNEFGKVDYKNTAQLEGTTKPTLNTPSVRVDFIVPEEEKPKAGVEMYDIYKPTTESYGVKQADLIAKRINEYVGMAYKDKEGNSKRIQYGDIVILMRSLTDKAVDIYNVLVGQNIPVTASFKIAGFASKEVREIVNLLRIIDNPYNDVCLAGVCLSSMGGFAENELATVRLASQGKIPFFDRLQAYVSQFEDEIASKIRNLFALVDSLRFYSHGASVCDVVIKILQQTSFDLYVQGLPNGALRLRKLNAFVDSLKGASYAQSIDKFLEYVDEADETSNQQPLANTNAVRLMTMHASKGLEFPVVILAGLETGFRFDTLPVEKNAQFGVANKYYDFEMMKKFDTLGIVACNLANKIKQTEEEMRLLYVAMTRAKFVLDMVATVSQKRLDGVPPMPSEANSHVDWILSALRATPKLRKSDDGSLCVQAIKAVAFETKFEQDYMCEQYTDKDMVLDKLSYVYPYQSQTQMPSKIVSSALDKIYLDDEELKPAPVIVQDDRERVGTAYHTVYQFVSYDADDQQIRQTIEGLVNEGKIERQYADQLDVDLIFATLQNPQLRAIMAKGKVYHEIPFMLYAPYDQLAKDKRFSDKVMLQGVIDMLVVGQNHATVVDFKYTTRSDKVAERYPYQLASYKLAVQQICQINDVDCYVLSIDDNKLIKM